MYFPQRILPQLKHSLACYQQKINHTSRINVNYINKCNDPTLDVRKPSKQDIAARKNTETRRNKKKR